MKTPKEMAEKWYWANLTEESPVVMLTNPVKHPPCPRKAFLAGYQAAKDQLQLQPFHEGADVYIIDANNPLPKPMPLSIAKQDQLADASKVMNSSKKLDGWISVKDQLPEPNMSVLVLFKKRITLAAIEEKDDEFIETGRFRVWKALKLQKDDIYECYPWKDITHWMPLPEAPTGEKEEGGKVKTPEEEVLGEE